MSVSGFDKLQKQLKEAQKAIASLDDELGSVNFDPFDPVSLEAAIQKASGMVDERIGAYASNPFVSPLISELKEKYRGAILEKAAEARLMDDSDG